MKNLQPLEFIDYLLNCTLATIESMTVQSKPKKGEFRRQCAIAQKTIDYLGPGFYGFNPRAARIVESGLSVEDYYVQYMVKNGNTWMLAGGK